MTTAIIIPAFNGLEYLKQNLPRLKDQKNTEIIIVDDASTDGTSEFITQKYPKIHLITNAKNTGFTKAVNIGVRASSADIIFLLNQDVVVKPNLVKMALPYFKVNPQLFAVTFNEGKFGYADVRFSRGFIHFSNHQSSSAHASFWASGGSCAFRKSAWDKLGGFDTVFSPGYFEDLDLGWRARKQGWEIIWTPEITVDHIHETAFKKAYSATDLQRIKDRNYLLCQWKNLDTVNLYTHVVALIFRCLTRPGFIIPTSMALNHLIPVVSYRRKHNKLLSDSQVFNV